VALHVVFQDRAALDAYMTAPKHIELIEKHQSTGETCGRWTRASAGR